MDYDESLILFTLLRDPRAGAKTYQGLTRRQISERTGLKDEVVRDKLTTTGRGVPELREEAPYPYVSKRGNRYSVHTQTKRHLIIDPRHCRIFLQAVALARKEHSSISAELLAQTCEKELRMKATYLTTVIGDLVRRGYLVKDDSREEEGYEPYVSDFELEKIYYAFLLGVIQPGVLEEPRRKEQLARLDDDLFAASGVTPPQGAKQ